jgi:hypothetical protein
VTLHLISASRAPHNAPIGNRVTTLMMIDPEIATEIKAAAWTIMEYAARDWRESAKKSTVQTPASKEGKRRCINSIELALRCNP